MDHPAAGRAGPTRPRARVRFLLLCVAAAHCPLAVSCKPNKRYDLIEAELRTRDRELAETRAALDRSRTINQAYEQSRLPEFPGAPPPPVVGVPAACPVREIAVGRGTGGVDDDGVPGDEALMVVIVPTDEDRSSVKVPARATISAWEITPQGLKNPVGTWELSAEQLRPTWRSGLLATGYFVTVPWQTYPATDRLRVAVRLTATDGRAYEADRDVSVHPMVNAGPRVAPPAPPPVPQPLLPGQPPAGVPSGLEELPPPASLPQPDRGARLLPPR